MLMRALLAGETKPANGAPAPACFRCHATPAKSRLFKCVEVLRGEWIACLDCARSGAKPKPWPADRR